MGGPEPARPAGSKTSLKMQLATLAGLDIAAAPPLRPVRSMIVALATVFVAEVLVMLLLPVLFSTGGGRWIKDVVDAAILTLLAAPVLWYFIIRPLYRYGESEHAHCRAIVGAAADGIVAITADGTIDMFNGAATHLFGYTSDEVVGKNVKLLMPSPHKQRHDEYLARFKRTGVPRVIGLACNVFAVRKDGSEFPVEIAISEVHMTPRSAFVAIVRDITERAQAEASLRLTRFVVDHVGESVLWISRSGRFFDVNAAACRHLGYSRKDLLSLSVSDIDPDTPKPAWDQLWERLHKLRYDAVESRHRAKDGRIIPVEIAANLLEYGGKEFVCAFVRDITERKAAEEKLRVAGQQLESRVQSRTAELEVANSNLRRQIEERKRAEHRLLRMAAAVESAGEAILITDLDGVIEYVNPAFGGINGFTPEQALGKTPNILKSGKHEDLFYRDMWATLKAGRVWRGELVNRRGDGSLIDVEKTISPIRDAQGQPIGYVAIARDITERKRMLEALEAVVRGTALVADDSFFRSLAYHLAAALRTRGACVCEILPLGRRAKTLAWWDDGRFGDNCEYELAGTPCEQAIEHGIWSCSRELQRLFPNDSLLAGLHAEAYIGVALTDAAGLPIGILAVTHDRPLEHAAVAEPILKIFAMRATSELRRQQIEQHARQREGELAHVLRLSTMGEMASGLAHEINQPLSAIATHAAACARRLASGGADTDKLAGAVTHIAEQAERAGQIVRRIRRFVVKQEPKASTIDLNEIVREAESLARYQARQQSVDIDLRLGDDLPLVVADRIQLQQVLHNLIRNALDAMSGDAPERQELFIETRRGERGTIEVSVRDSGPGLAGTTAERIFDPFFSTKSKGLGMGLSISRTIIESHGGRLWAASAQGGGAVFRFTLPTANGGVQDG